MQPSEMIRRPTTLVAAAANDEMLTMTSREIAELTGKEHKHVMRDIRTLLGELDIDPEGYAQNWTDPQNSQSYPMFSLPKRETLILVSGYSVAMRAAIIDRWQELEKGAAVQRPLSPAEMFLQNAQAMVTIERAQAQQAAEQQRQAIRLQDLDTKVDQIEATRPGYPSAGQLARFRNGLRRALVASAAAGLPLST